MEDSKKFKVDGSVFDQYNQFGDACSIPKGTISFPGDADFLEMCIGLVEEEWSTETRDALDRYRAHPSIENFAEVADGIVDTVYVLMQLARVLGVPFNQAWDEVHQANMRKVGEDGLVTRRGDGKILKPAGWEPPKIWDICYAEYVKVMKQQQGHKQGEILGDME